MLVVFIAFVVFLIVGMPIAFAIGISGALYFLQHLNLPATIMVQLPLTQAQNFSLLAVPLFIFAGNLLNCGGTTDRLAKFAGILTEWRLWPIYVIGFLLMLLVSWAGGKLKPKRAS